TTRPTSTCSSPSWPTRSARPPTRPTMPVSMAVALAGLAITVIVGFTKTISAIAQLQFKVDLMWDAFRGGGGSGHFGVCRFKDLPGHAHDDGRQDTEGD